jgi:hypothetical protein
MKVGGPYGAGKLTKVKVNKLGLNGPQTLYLVYKAPAEQKVDEKAVATAASADAAIVFVGTDENTATEEADRLSLVLPGNQVELIKAVAAANPNTIVVMQTLGCVEVEAFKNLQNIPGIIWVGYNGQAQGEGIASILFGEANPGGKLNGTWYKSGNDLPDITDYTLRGGAGKNGRTFWYFNKDVSYEFGYGLSYTTFEYSNFKISKTAITPHDKITVSVDVKNTGKVEGDEVVQVYMKTPDSPASAQRPIKRLKGFKRVTIPAGQTKMVNIDIDCTDLWFWDMAANKITFDQGRYVFEIGASSKDIKGSVTATMNGKFNPTLKVVVADCGTVVLKNGETAQTSVSAAMTDDSFYDTNKAKIVYTSNNPEVASVNEKGLVTAKGTGVANITAFVTIDGHTESGSFPIKVMPELKVASLSVDGKKISNFKPEVQEYPYLLSNVASAPKVDAVPVSSNVALNIVPAKAVPGSSVITLSDNVSVESNQYVVNFGTKSANDEFNGAIGKQWNWVRENPSNYSLSKKPGSLLITSAKGDIVSNNNNAENILLQSANTNWVIESKIVFSKKPSGMSQNGGLLAYQDDDNFVKLVYSAGMGGRRGAPGAGAQAGTMQLIVEENGYQKSTASLSMGDIIKADNTLFVKFEKKGDQYTASVSPDGKKYTTIGSVKVLLTNIKAGLIVCEGVVDPRMRAFGGGRPGQAAPEPDKTPFEVMFDYFRINNSGLK